MSVATAQKPQTNTNQPTRKPKRFREHFDGLNLEYVRKRARIAQLFGLEDLVQDFPSLNEYVPVRCYFVAGTDEPFEHPLVPAIEPNFKFDVFDLAVLLPYVVEGKGFPPYLFGLHGTGKTSTLVQLHARLGLPRVSIILGEDSEVIDLGGQMLPTEAGGMRFQDGLLVQAMRNGWSLQIDEFDLLPTRQQKMMNEVFENRNFTIEVTGEQVHAHPNWRAMITANTNNTGSSGHMFVSGGSGDASVNERFQFIQKFYLDKEEEKQLLMEFAKPMVATHPKVIKKPDLADQLLISVEAMIDNMQTVAERIRKAHEQSKMSQATGVTLDCTLSTRALKQWLRSAIQLSIFFDGAKGGVLSSLLPRAFKTSFVNGISLDEQEDVMQILNDSLVSDS